MPVLIHRGIDWKVELANLRRDCVQLRQDALHLCCEFQREPSTNNLERMLAHIATLKAAERRKQELEEVADWIAARVQQQQS